MEGISSAQNSIIVVTDADCEHSKTWLETILTYFEKDTGIVAGPVDYIADKKLFKKFQRLEFAGLILTGAGLIGIGKPTICSAANLAYRKNVFEEVGGFETELNFSSGDDDLFLQKVASRTKYKVKYALSRNAMVRTNPKENVTDFLEQRKRWASKNLFYESKFLVAQILLLALFYLGLVIQPVLGILVDTAFLYLFLISIIFKMIFEFFIIKYGAETIYDRKILSVFFIAEIFQIPYIIYSGVSGLFGNFKWKGERVNR
ncbi:MAG: glycosyltransferase [Melioribacteraceae bacterium]|nr:glycosyltransferase [Melioribacteraceae bacterium]